MMYVLQIHMYGILTVVLPSTLLHSSVTCLLALSLRAYCSAAAGCKFCYMCKQLRLSSERGVGKIVLMVALSHYLMYCMYLASKRTYCQFLH